MTAVNVVVTRWLATCTAAYCLFIVCNTATAAGTSPQRVSEPAHRVIRSEKLIVECIPVWSVGDQTFNVTVEWTVSSSEPINIIDYFVIQQTQYEGDGTTYISGSYSEVTVYRETDVYSYNDLSIVSPKKYPAIGNFLVIPHFSEIYNGYQESCEASLSPTPPGEVENLKISSYTIQTTEAFDKHLAQIDLLEIEWNVPSSPVVTNLSSLGYEVWVGANSSDEDSGDIFDLDNIMAVNEETYSGSIMDIVEHYTVIPGSASIFVKLRCYYTVTFDDQEYEIYSNWSGIKALAVFSKSSSSIMQDTSHASITATESTRPVNMMTTTNYAITMTISTSKVHSPQTLSMAYDETVMTSSVISSSIVIPQVAGSKSANNSSITIMLVAILTPAVLLVIVIAVVVIVVACVRRRQRKFQILSSQLDSSLMYREEENLIFKGRSRSDCSVPSISHQNTLETSLECCDEWEVPAKSVILTDRLGEGCFGEVFKGEIKGFKNTHLIAYQTRQNDGRYVAVKVLKTNASNQEKNDFLKEIELMKVIATGKNPHVVNMIGAVTRQEPMCVVTEFLEHGDLLSYLKTCRKKMNLTEKVNEVNVSKDESNGYIQEQPPESVNLVSFAYQIASGMEYLSSLKIIHRDLACRNILVGEGKVLKVSDFGLSRNMTYDSAYVKTTNGPLPIRWMAIESIMYHEFTTSSDVWSFAITLWEIGTLGAVPYPNIDNSDILRSLQMGCRIDKPKNISDEVYDLMLKCCNENPSNRPSFSNLRKQFDMMLSRHKSDREMYLDLSCNPETKLSINGATSPMNIKHRPTSNVYVDNSAMYSNLGTPSNVSTLSGSSTTCTPTVENLTMLPSSPSPVTFGFNNDQKDGSVYY